MNFFSKKRLKIVEKENKTICSWNRLNMFDMFLVPLLFIHVIWGIGSYLKMEEIIGIKVLQMNSLATILFWSFGLLFLSHLIFNRKILLIISASGIKYKSGLFYAKNIKTNDLFGVSIEEKPEDFAESPPDARDLTSYHLYIQLVKDKTYKIKDLSKKDCEIVKKIINTYLPRN